MSVTAYRAFHEASALQGWQVDRLHESDPKSWPEEWNRTELRRYERFPGVALATPDTSAVGRTSLLEALRRRRSERRRTTQPLQLGDLGALVSSALGCRPTPEAPIGARRLYPSAGARFPVEAYFLVSRVERLADGCYAYVPARNELVCLRAEPVGADAQDLVGWDRIEPPRLVVLLSAVMRRTYAKYGERGYRYALLEAGHVMQNLCLAGAALGIPVTPLGGFDDATAGRLIGDIFGSEIVLYVGIIP
jgi:SagB-type dehydrogenase family enzyme